MRPVTCGHYPPRENNVVIIDETSGDLSHDWTSSLKNVYYMRYEQQPRLYPDMQRIGV